MTEHWGIIEMTETTIAADGNHDGNSVVADSALTNAVMVFCHCLKLWPMQLQQSKLCARLLHVNNSFRRELYQLCFTATLMENSAVAENTSFRHAMPASYVSINANQR